MLSDREGGGWQARTRAAALMYASGGALAGLSMLPGQPVGVHRSGILVVAAVALATALGILATGRHYTLAMSHMTSAAGTVIIATAIWMAGGSYLSALYAMFYIWVALFSVFFYGTKGALAHATLCSAAVALGLAELPPGERVLTWGLVTATLYIVVACYAVIRRYTKRLHRLVEHSGGIVTILDPDLTITYHSALAERILGYGTGELVHRDLLDLVHPEDQDAVRGVLSDAAAESSATTMLECRIRHSDGSWRHVESSVENMLSDASVEGIVLSLRDVTERRRLQEQLAYQAFHDPLTGLANRALFTDRVSRSLKRAANSPQRPGLLFLDLDDFKSVNDSLGHAAGDELLLVVADRLRTSLRAADTVARLGGDEFAVLVDSCQGEEELAHTAQRLLDVLRRAVVLEGHDIVVTPSIGGAVASTGLEKFDDLLRDADAAMYLAKERGKGRYETFQPGMSAQLVRRAQLKSDLRRAVERGELRLVYQPTVDLATGHVRGMEALVRWLHPSLGMLSPAEFIPLAEETGLIVQIGSWVLHEACAQAKRWQRDNPSWPSLLMSVNVSARQLHDDDFVHDVETALRDSGLEPSRLALELTETVVVQDSQGTIQRLQRLKDTGVTIALDDFGTGYSTLSYLQSLPVDLIKVDKSFIDQLANPTGRQHDFMEAVVNLIQSMKLPSVAEGIESEQQAQQLRQLNCEYGQGFLFARPLAAEDVQSWIDEACRTTALAHAAGL